MSDSREPPRPLPTEPSLPASFWWLSVVTTVVPTLVLGFTTTFAGTLGPWTWPAHSGVIGLTILVVWWLYVRDRNQLQRLLAEHGRRVCPRCRYPLSTLEPSGLTDRCPECGTVNDPEGIEKMWAAWEASMKRRGG